MTDRRTRPPRPCQWPDCPQLGGWVLFCPGHYRRGVAALRAAVDERQRARNPEPPPDPYATASALLGGQPQRKEPHP